jgi:hypothetical protein
MVDELASWPESESVAGPAAEYPIAARTRSRSYGKYLNINTLKNSVVDPNQKVFGGSESEKNVRIRIQTLL